jgi:hypothetical protein
VNGFPYFGDFEEDVLECKKKLTEFLWDHISLREWRDKLRELEFDPDVAEAMAEAASRVLSEIGEERKTRAVDLVTAVEFVSEWA